MLDCNFCWRSQQELIAAGVFTYKMMQLDLCFPKYKTRCDGGNVKKTSVQHQMLPNLRMADHP